MTTCPICGAVIPEGIGHACARSTASLLVRPPTLPMLDTDAQLELLHAKYVRAINALRDIAALKAKPKTSGREIAIHALAMLGEPRETE